MSMTSLFFLTHCQTGRQSVTTPSITQKHTHNTQSKSTQYRYKFIQRSLYERSYLLLHQLSEIAIRTLWIVFGRRRKEVRGRGERGERRMTHKQRAAKPTVFSSSGLRCCFCSASPPTPGQMDIRWKVRMCVSVCVCV